jgi:hypothetical protein
VNGSDRENNVNTWYGELENDPDKMTRNRRAISLYAMFVCSCLDEDEFDALEHRFNNTEIWQKRYHLLKELRTKKVNNVRDIYSYIQAKISQRRSDSFEKCFRDIFKEYYTALDPYAPEIANDSQRVENILKEIVLVRDNQDNDNGDRTTYTFFTRLIQDNIIFPMSFLVFRMYITFQAGSSVFMKKGSDTGVLTVKDTAVMLDRITTDFKLSVQARFTAGTVIHNTDNITIMPHTYATAYKGGAGTKIFNPCSDDHVSVFQEGNCSIADLFVVAVPYDFECAEYWTDITGEMNKLMYVNDASDHNRKQSNDMLMYPTANLYQATWGWVHPMDHHALEFRNEEIYDVRDETLAIQSYQRNFNANSGLFDIEIEGKGPMGARVRPQDFRILQGGGDEYGGRGIEGSSMRPRD